MTQDEIRALLNDLESDRVERTISTTNTDKFGQAICAFANDLPDHRMPGYLFLGVADDGEVKGVNVTDELLKNVAAIRTDGNIQPQPSMTVEKVPMPEGDIVMVRVEPAIFPPVKYKGRIWIRIGPRKGVANEDDERIEMMNHGGLYGRANEQNFPKVNDYRNIVVAEAMKVLGFVNRHSRGVLRVQKDLKANENGEAVYDFSYQTAVMVTEMKSPRGERATTEAIANGFLTEADLQKRSEKGSDLTIFEGKGSQKPSNLTENDEGNSQICLLLTKNSHKNSQICLFLISQLWSHGMSIKPSS